MDKDELKQILEDHKKWLNKNGGSWADLSRADLSGADLRWADLSGADLRWANLSEADLSRADLSRADLSEANLSGADLRGADLSGADLRWANLSRADLRGADLSGADLRGADLRWANLSEADLRWAIGNMLELKSMQLENFAVCYSKTDLAIGCQQHPIEEWWSFNDEQIEKMVSGAGKLWEKWKPLLKQIIEMSPAD